jgi:hypothetical protein
MRACWRTLPYGFTGECRATTVNAHVNSTKKRKLTYETTARNSDAIAVPRIGSASAVTQLDLALPRTLRDK